MNIHEGKIFMHDGAPCRTAKVVTSCLKNEKVEVFPWPENSTDLNPTKNLRKIKKNNVTEQQPTYINKTPL